MFVGVTTCVFSKKNTATNGRCDYADKHLKMEAEDHQSTETKKQPEGKEMIVPCLSSSK
jgi:hypothetical protein